MTPSALSASPFEPRLGAGASARARRVRLVLMDVDGVLTDGRIVFEGPEDETKFFDAQDGVGVRLAIQAGLRIGLITGRRSLALRRRADELGITDVRMNAARKGDAFVRMAAGHRLRDDQVCFVGDDVVDLPALRRAGFAATVPNARPEVIRVAHFVTGRPGGRGAVREVLDFILKAQGSWRRVTRAYA
jgi:3-deoxy-D-manno-octulosonate 8-phosphate phosphatase (KDO 8-P phosphatase)